MNQTKYLITPSLLNSWKYAISQENDYGNLEEFIKTLSREPIPSNEAMQNGYKFEDYMIANYEPTKNGCYQIKLSKDIATKTGTYVLYGRLDCLKAGRIFDYKYTGSYDVGKFFNSYQTLIYFEICPEANSFEYLISNNYKDGKTLEEINLYHEVYLRDDMKLNIHDEVDSFIEWLRTNNLYDLYTSMWKSKY